MKTLLRPVLTTSLILSFTCALMHAANWYVAPAAQGSHNGTSYGNAWSPAQIVWGGSGVVAGDIVNLDCGTTSNTFTTAVTVGSSGSAGNLITIQSSTDANHNGTCIFDGQGRTSSLFNGDGRNFIKLEGNNRLIFQNNQQVGSANSNPLIHSDTGTGNIIQNVEVKHSGDGVWWVDQTSGLLANLNIHDIARDFALNMVSRNLGGSAYGTGTEVRNSTISVNNDGLNSDGIGPDAIQNGAGNIIHDSSILAVSGTVDSGHGQHQDGCQCEGLWTEFYNNVVIGFGNTGLDDDWELQNTGVCGHEHIWNNTFSQVAAKQSQGAGIWVATHGNCSSFTDFSIVNNTFADFTGRQAIYLQDGNSSAVWSNIVVENNIVFNSGSEPNTGGQVGQPIRLETGNYTCGSTVVVDYNNVNAGSNGGTVVVCNNNTYSQPHGQSGAPVFTSYAEYSASNDYHLQSSSSPDIGQAINLTSSCTSTLAVCTDKDGAARPSSGAWDLGAYEFSSSNAPSAPTGLAAIVQ